MPTVPIGQYTDWLDMPVAAQEAIVAVYQRVRNVTDFNRQGTIPQLWIRLRYTWDTFVAWNLAPTRLYYGDVENGAATISGYIMIHTSACVFQYGVISKKWRIGRIF